MASYSFAFIHFIGTSTNLLEGPAYNITGASTPTTPLTEADVTIDGSTAVGDAVEYSGSTFYYRGTTDQGGVMISTSPTGAGQTWLLADSNLSGQNVFFEATGPYLYCFLAGSQIATPAGEVAVEALRIGDTILTACGREVPVKWIGRQTVATRFGPAERLMPIRFTAGALGDGLPHSDLTVTADHGMLVDGVICHAGALVNGTAITHVPLAEMGETYTVYHIETEAHEIILANGAPAETFIDNISRRVFDNYAEFEALYGDVPEMEELPFPRAMSARQVPFTIKNRLGWLEVA
jgi:hypothetical protein